MNAREPVDPTRHFRLTSDSGWNDVQAQYRLLVQRWHPDRHPAETRAEAQAEFIEIVAAFKRLRRHYDEHGRLPAPDPAPSAGAVPGRNPAPPSAGETRLRAVLRSPLTAVLAALLLAAALATLVRALDERLEREHRARAPSHTIESRERTPR